MNRRNMNEVVFIAEEEQKRVINFRSEAITYHTQKKVRSFVESLAIRMIKTCAKCEFRENVLRIHGQHFELTYDDAANSIGLWKMLKLKSIANNHVQCVSVAAQQQARPWHREVLSAIKKRRYKYLLKKFTHYQKCGNHNKSFVMRGLSVCVHVYISIEHTHKCVKRKADIKTVEGIKLLTSMASHKIRATQCYTVHTYEQSE